MLDKTDISVCIIDYGMGNLRSVYRTVEQMVTRPILSADPHVIKQADKLILPGVGHFRQGMINLRDSGIMEVMDQRVCQEGTPILGICLGMQLFTSYSEEGDCEGLGWIDAKTSKFDSTLSSKPYFKVPHMGWNTLTAANNSALTSGVNEDDEFYFCHSYYVTCEDTQHVTSTCRYGLDFHASIQRDNIHGVQFHPEKSHGDGAQLIRQFIGLGQEALV